LSREHNLDFQLRRAKMGPVAANSLQYGGGVMIGDAATSRILSSSIDSLWRMSFLAERPTDYFAGAFNRHHQSRSNLQQDVAAGVSPASAAD
jgi:hypothetical protein